MVEERLQRALARAGYGSRRSSEELIAQGKVRVNGRVATQTLADPAASSQFTYTVDGSGNITQTDVTAAREWLANRSLKSEV